MAQTLVNAYLELPLGERDAALTSLVRSFGQRDRDFVQGLISDTRDPFYNLPIELLIYVFDFLHPFDIWTKRLVCRRWKKVLSSDRFVRNTLSRFDTHDAQDSALDPEMPASSRHRTALSHVLALRKGRPFNWVDIRDEFACAPSVHSSTQLLRLKGKHIAYLRGNPDTREGNTVVIRDLISGEVTPLCGIAREKIMSIELTPQIVAFFTHTGLLYIASLLSLTDTLQSIRLPSSVVLATSSCRLTLACLIKGSSTLIAVIHDARTRRTHSFELHPARDFKEDMSCCTMLLDSQEQCIDVFIIRAPTDAPTLRVDMSRYSYAGTRTTHTSFTMRHELSLAQNVSIDHVEPTGEKGIHHLPLRYSDGSSLIRWSLIYDATMITLKAIDCFPHMGTGDHRLVPNHALWKDRLYRGEMRGHAVVAAQRSELHDGPHTLRNIPNQAKPEVTKSDDDSEEESENEEEEEKVEEGKGRVDVRSDSLFGAPSRLSSWRADRQEHSFKHFEQARLNDIPSKLPAHLQQPLPPLGAAFYSAAFCKSRHHFHTIIAMNDTFAVATCFNPCCIGVACFDERVELHGARKTGCTIYENLGWGDRSKVDAIV